ncbi:MAG: cytochrome c3 family protein [Desulfovibrionaceae bacterium]|nr:cytochrome c3 family protein [Desulfovibrionaceae bacterium]
MKKRLFLSCILALALAVPALASQPAVPDQPLEFKGAKKTVIFNHSTHQSVECVACHHNVDGKANYQKCATSGCHDDLTAKKGLNSLYAVVHARSGLKYDTCLSCHLKLAADQPDKKKELAGCSKSKCHP